MSDAVTMRRRLLLGGLGAVAGVAAVIGGMNSIVVAQPSVRSFWRGHGATSVAFAPDGRTALAGSWDGMLNLLDLATGRERTTSESSFRIESIAFAPAGGTALFGSFTKVMLWDVAKSEPLRTFWDPDMPLVGGNADTQYAHSEDVHSVAFAPDGLTALSGGGDNLIRLWDVATGKPLRIFTGHANPVEAVAFSPDGRTALSGSLDDTLKLWDIGTGKELRTLKGSSFRILSVAFSPDSRTALSGGYDATLRLWDLETGRELRIFRGHAGPVNSVAFSPDGRTALSGAGSSLLGGNDKTARLWEVATGKQLRTLSEHSAGVYSVAFSPDGRTALSAGGDGVKLWRLTGP